jgi:uracil-DNA glycosylase
MALNLIEPWQAVLHSEFEQPYMQQLRAFLVEERQAGKTLYPPADLVFNAFNHCAPDQVKVVMLGQDPYHGPQQAHGLCFSVPAGVKTPPSLVNIYKELHADVGMPIPTHGNLESWAAQGVFMLNTVLTVAAGQAASHQKQGWEQFTDKVIHLINESCPNVVFMLWGSYAQKKAGFVDQQKHLVLKAPHPSPLSAHRGFLGCQHFSQANQWLQAKGLAAIQWDSVLAA